VSDIFLSYASADREWAKMLAEALAEQGWSVWWDRVIPPGKQFDEVIEEALDGAKCVVVLWTHASVASTWVKTEAAEAMRRKVLIPALMEDVRIPLEFRRLQAADLAGWQGDRSDPRLIPFYESIGAEVKRPGQAGGEPVVKPRNPPAAEQPRRIEVPPPRRPDPAPPVPQRKRSPLVIGAVVAAVVALLGAGLYSERAKNIETAERAAREKAAYEQAERDRERAARDEAARQEAARADAQRRTEEQRRQQADRAAREEAARAASQRRADEERRTRQQAGSGTQQGVPPSGVVSLQWRDHALGFNGSLTWSPSSAVLRAAVVDLKTGIRIGTYAVPARVLQQGPVEYLVSAEFAVPGDSTTPGPHTHTSRLLLRAQQDGSVRVVQNCPRPGDCY